MKKDLRVPVPADTSRVKPGCKITSDIDLRPIPGMMTSWHGHAFRVTGPLWGESTDDRWIPSQRASNAEFDFFYVSLNKLLNKLLNK